MLNPFKDFLKPKYVVGLEVKEGFIGAVQVFNGLKGPEIDKAAFREVSNPEQLQEELEAFLREESFKTEMVVVALPASKAFIRDITLTLDNPKVVEKIIKFQMEPHIPLPIEEVIVDFLEPGADGSVSTFGVEKRHIAECLAFLAGAGVDPDVVTLDALALLHLYLYRSGEESEQPAAVVYLDRESTLIEIVYRNRPDFFRVFPDGEQAPRRIEETLRLYKLKRPEVSVNEILLSGNGLSNPDVVQTIGSRTGVKTTAWRASEDVLFQPMLSVPLGLALSAAQPAFKPVNLRKEEFLPKSHVNLRKMFFFTASAVLLLAVLLTVNVYQKVFYLEKQYEGLQQEIRQAFVQSFPDVGRIVKGQELVQLEQKIAEATGRYHGLEEVTGKDKTLDVLLKLTTIISEDPEVQIDNLSLEGKDIRLDGRTSSFEAVDRLTNRLNKSGEFSNIKLVGAKMDKRENAVTFNFALERNG
jgi:type II secretory pathway component PulL